MIRVTDRVLVVLSKTTKQTGTVVRRAKGNRLWVTFGNGPLGRKPVTRLVHRDQCAVVG